MLKLHLKFLNLNRLKFIRSFDFFIILTEHTHFRLMRILKLKQQIILLTDNAEVFLLNLLGIANQILHNRFLINNEFL